MVVSPGRGTRPARPDGWLVVPSRPRAQRVLRWSMALGGLLTVAYTVAFWVVPRPNSGYVTLWDGWIATIVAGLPAVGMAAAVGLRRRARLGWSVMSLAVLLNLAGNLVSIYHDQNLDPLPFPALSDVPWLASYVACAAALALLTQRGRRVHRTPISTAPSPD